MLDNCGIQRQCLDQVRSDESFVFFATVPTPDWSLGLSIYFLTVVIKDYLVNFNIISSISDTL